MPAAVSGNAVAVAEEWIEVYSLMGIGPKKTWDDVSNKVYVLHIRVAKWSESRAVPGVAGRIGASAVGVGDTVFLFGGYSWTTREMKSRLGTSTPIFLTKTLVPGRQIFQCPSIAP